MAPAKRIENPPLLKGSSAISRNEITDKMLKMSANSDKKGNIPEQINVYSQNNTIKTLR